MTNDEFYGKLDDLKRGLSFSRLGKTFQTLNQKYYYDTGTGKVLQCSDHIYQIFKCLEKTNFIESIKELGIPNAALNSAFKEIFDSVENENILQAPILNSFAGAHIDSLERYVDYGLEHITLEMTERCNLRCDYCIYQDENDLFRGYGSEDMTFDIAQKAIDYAAAHSGKDLAVTFYGGEPLLKMELVKECVAYCKEKLGNKNLTFAMTSNMILMTKEVAQYIAGIDNFIVTASIDGDKHIHDEHRVFSDGSGSFDAVMEGLKNYAEAVKQENKKIEERLTLSMVLCPPYTNKKFDEIQKFFDTLVWLPRNVVKNASYVQYERQEIPDISDTQMLSYEDVDPLGKWTMEQVHNNNTNGISETFNANDFEKTLLRIHKRRLCQIPMDNAPFNACCVPASRRLYITSSGQFKVCEKIGLSPYVGDVYKGADLDTIRENYVDRYMLQSINQCKNCWAIHLCNVCYAECYDEEGIRMDGKYALYEGTRYGQEKALINYYSILESNPEALEHLNNISIK